MMDDCGDFAGRSAAALPSHSLAHSLEPLKCRVTPSLTLTRIHNGSRSSLPPSLPSLSLLTPQSLIRREIRSAQRSGGARNRLRAASGLLLRNVLDSQTQSRNSGNTGRAV